MSRELIKWKHEKPDNFYCYVCDCREASIMATIKTKGIILKIPVCDDCARNTDAELDLLLRTPKDKR